MDKKRAVVKNTFIIATGSLSVQLVSFLLLPFYTSYLSAEEFGAFDLILTYISLFTPIVTLQLGMSAFRFLIDARDNADAKTRIISNVLSTIGVQLLVFSAVFLLISRYIHVDYAYWVLATICTYVPMGIFAQFARGFGKNAQFAISAIISGVLVLVLNVVLIAGFNMGANGMLLSGVIGNIAAALYLFIALRLSRYINFSLCDRGVCKDLVKYSWPLVPNALSWWVISAFDRTIIASVLGVAANGIYAIAYKFPIVFISTFSFFSMSWTEAASMHINSKDRDKFFSEICSGSIRFFGSLAAVMIAGIALLFNVFIGAEYHDAYGYIPILIAASFFNAVVGLYSAVYIAKKMTRQVLNTSVFAAAINVVLSLILIQFIGMYGTALAAAAAYLSMAIYRHYDTKKYVVITYEKNVFAKVGLLYAFAVCLYYYGHPMSNVVSAVAVSAVAIFFNRSALAMIKNKLTKRLKKVSPDQEVARQNF